MQSPVFRNRQPLVVGVSTVVLAVMGAAAASAAVIVGTDGDDSLVGTRAADSIDARAGNDNVHGAAGWDTIVGGAGDDVLYGDRGGDSIHGDAGVDVLRGGYGPDSLFLGGNDTGFGGPQRDRLYIGSGDSVARGWSGDDLIVSAVDPPQVDTGTHRLYGDAGADRFFLDNLSRATVVYGGPGVDRVDIGSDLRVVNLGGGSDSVNFQAAGRVVAGPGDDVMDTRSGYVPDKWVNAIDCGDGYDTANIDPWDTVTNCEDVTVSFYGTNSDDDITGTSGKDIFSTLYGDDRLIGLGGDDTFYPAQGSDYVDAGAGADLIDAREGYLPDPVDAVDRIHCGAGDDVVDAEATDVVASDCETVHIVPPGS